MAKKEAEKDAGEKLKEADAKGLKPDGSPSRPFPWVEPFPASVLADDGKTETVFVRALANQDLILNGEKKTQGINHILPCDFAHTHANALSAPKK